MTTALQQSKEQKDQNSRTVRIEKAGNGYIVKFQSKDKLISPLIWKDLKEVNLFLLHYFEITKE